MTKIFVTTEFEGIHCWPEAPEDVAFLRNPHRHMFKVRAEVEVEHHDRDIEFIMLKRDLDVFIKTWFLTDPTLKHYCGKFSKNRVSCEDIAQDILNHIESHWSFPKRVRKASVEVSEDGENGAILSTF